MLTNKLKIPTGEIAEAVKIALKSIKDQNASLQLEMERGTETEEEVRRLAGENGVQERNRIKEEFQNERRKLQEDAIRQIEGQEAAAVKFIDDEVTPNGNDITGDNAGDFALLEHDLITTPEKLQGILDRHENTAFRIAAEKYADRHEWKGFRYFDKEKPIRDYTAQVFEGIKRAVLVPNGLAAMQYTQQSDEFRRIALAYGIAEEFDASGGDKIENLFVRI